MIDHDKVDDYWNSIENDIPDPEPLKESIIMNPVDRYEELDEWFFSKIQLCHTVTDIMVQEGVTF